MGEEQQIPPDRTSWGGFALRDVSDARLHTMVDNDKIDDPDADRAKGAAFRESFMDEGAVERSLESAARGRTQPQVPARVIESA